MKPSSSHTVPPVHYYLEFLGCRLNAAEIETLSRRFEGSGGQIEKDPGSADVIVVNTCAVTQQAAQRSRRRIHKLHHLQPEAEIAVLGCWATDAYTTAFRCPGVKWVLPNIDKQRAVEIITGETAPPAPWIPGRWGHTRAFLAVQDGCDHTCTYCLTQVLRGPSRSRDLREAVNAARDMVINGAQELVLTGVSLGAYGMDLGFENGLTVLVKSILSETDVPRLRLSSIEPWDVKDSLLQQWENPRLCRQLHLPLQSGSDSVLRRMGRKISTAEYIELVNKVRQISPGIAITSDVIAGFQGETDDEFSQTMDFVEKLKFARLHVFPYSERAGTPAIHIPGSVPLEVRKRRVRKLQSLSERLSMAYQSGMVGQTCPVLYQGMDRNGVWVGLTDTYVKVKVESRRPLYNTIAETRIILVKTNYVEGELLHNAV
ncbi:MAG: MiaB/RimO family radical SAM methylthiotransferase [Anaerolineae bacterium]|nr:MiaB/RimO family radical SAM methylthiotransferase [Anaerolineae bacterium]